MKRKSVLITGGNSGIGLATASKFLAKDYEVIITGRNSDSLSEAKSQLNSENLDTMTADVSEVGEIKQMMDTLKANGVKLDALVINAAIAKPKPMASTSVQDFDEQVNINFKGAYFTLQFALELFSKNASVVFITSIANDIASSGFTVYAGTKAAIRAVASTAAVELIEQGIRVNCVSPGPIETPMFGKLGVDMDKMEKRKKELAEQVPISRFGKPEEIADLIYFLCSDRSSYIVGQEIAACGGRSLI